MCKKYMWEKAEMGHTPLKQWTTTKLPAKYLHIIFVIDGDTAFVFCSVFLYEKFSKQT